jgi:hypothetical protein
MPRSGFEPRTAAVGSRRLTAWAMARPKPATNRLSYGAAFFSPILSPLTTRMVTVEVFDPASTRVYLGVSHPLHVIERLCSFVLLLCWFSLDLPDKCGHCVAGCSIISNVYHDVTFSALIEKKTRMSIKIIKRGVVSYADLIHGRERSLFIKQFITVETHTLSVSRPHVHLAYKITHYKNKILKVTVIVYYIYHTFTSTRYAHSFVCPSVHIQRNLLERIL